MQRPTLLIAVALMCCFAPLCARGQGPVLQQYQNPDDADSSDNDPSLLGKVLRQAKAMKLATAGGQLTLTITAYSTGTTVTAGSHFMVIMFSTDFAGTVQGTAYSGGTDAFQAISPPGNYTVGAVTITRTAGSYRVLDMR